MKCSDVMEIERIAGEINAEGRVMHEYMDVLQCTVLHYTALHCQYPMPQFDSSLLKHSL